MLSYWLPLNGNLNNNGLSSLSPIPSTTLTYNDNGKIGKCFNSGSQYISLPLETVPTALSICFWIKPNSPSAWTNIFSLGVNDNRMEVSTTTQYYWYCDSSSTALIGSGTALFTLDNAVWNHICMTADGTTVKFYRNGSLVKTVSQTNSFSTAFGGQLKLNIGSRIAGNNMYKGYINDFRVYTDEVISLKQLQQIKSALVCHYKLSGIGGENLLVNSGNYTLYTPLTVSSNKKDGWNQSINLYASLEAGTTYTLSAKQDGTWISSHNTSGVDYTKKYNSLWLYLKDGTSYNFLNMTNGYANFTPTKSGNYYIRANTYSDGTNTVTVNYWDIKLEEGSKVTPWCPNPSDTLYSTLGFNDGIEYDCSGYGNNGTKVGTIAWSGDSARYSGSYGFDNSSKINISPYLSNGQQISEITISCWFKTDTLNSTQPNIVSLGNNSFLRFRVASSNAVWHYSRVGNTQVADTFSCKTLTDDTWHHIAYTFKNGIVRMYIDGEQIGAHDFSSTATYMTCASSNWGLTAYEELWEKFIGSLSDFRIYATALSAEDVKSLYNVSASIDKTGVLFCGEISECEGE